MVDKHAADGVFMLVQLDPCYPDLQVGALLHRWGAALAESNLALLAYFDDGERSYVLGFSHVEQLQ